MSFQFIPAYLCLFYLQRFFLLLLFLQVGPSSIIQPCENPPSQKDLLKYSFENSNAFLIFFRILCYLSLSLTLSRNLKYMCLSFYIKQTCYIFSWVLCLMPSNLPLIHLAAAAAAPFIILWSSGRSQPGVQSWSVADKSFAATWFLSLWRKTALDRGLGTLKLHGYAILGH